MKRLLSDANLLFISSNRPDGLKKAYVKLAPDCEALDVANKMGVI